MKAYRRRLSTWVEYQRIRTEVGMPKYVIRLSTLHPILASVR